PCRAWSGIPIAAQRDVVSAENPGKGRLTIRSAEDGGTASFQRAGAVPLTMAAKSLQRFVTGEHRAHTAPQQFLLRLAVSAGDPFVRAQSGSVESLSARRALLRTVVIGQNELRLLLRGERCVKLADQSFGGLGWCVRGSSHGGRQSGA